MVESFEHPVESFQALAGPSPDRTSLNKGGSTVSAVARSLILSFLFFLLPLIFSSLAWATHHALLVGQRKRKTNFSALCRESLFSV